jgi:hypothetical protein
MEKQSSTMHLKFNRKGANDAMGNKLFPRVLVSSRLIQSQTPGPDLNNSTTQRLNFLPVFHPDFFIPNL